MKTTVRLFVLSCFLLGAATKSNSQCTVSDIFIQNTRVTGSTATSCTVKFDVTFNIEDNNGNKLIFIHAWLQADYPNYFRCVNGQSTINGSIAAPKAADLGNSFVNIGLDNVGPNPLVLTSYPADPTVPLATMDSAAKVVLPDGTANITLYGVVATSPVACATPVVVVADLWSSQSSAGQRAHCVNCGIRSSGGFLTTAGFVNCLTLNYQGSITNNTNTPITGFYRVFADVNGDGYFTPTTDTLLQTNTPFSVGGMGFQTISGPVPVANINQDIFIVVTQSSGAGLGASRVILFRSTQCGVLTLPVSFKSLTATRTSTSNVMLKWETATEINNDGFSIERNNGNAWVSVAFVSSQALAGNSSSVLSYSFNDLNSNKGITQYRIKQIDIDGATKLSEIRIVRGDAQTGKIIVFPNPSSSGTVNIAFENKMATRNVLLTDLNGRTIKQWNGLTNTTLVIEKLNGGVYFLRVTEQETGTQSVEKIIVY